MNYTEHRKAIPTTIIRHGRSRHVMQSKRHLSVIKRTDAATASSRRFRFVAIPYVRSSTIGLLLSNSYAFLHHRYTNYEEQNVCYISDIGAFNNAYGDGKVPCAKLHERQVGRQSIHLGVIGAVTPFVRM